jgi:hypothetical protein
MNRASRKIWDGLTSLSLTITSLALLMVLVVACTLAQVRLGTIGAVTLYMRSWFYWMDLGSFRIPIFPAGATVGLVLLVNLVLAQGRRLKLTWSKAGIWIVHAGLILLFVGEFVTAGYQTDAQLAIFGALVHEAVALLVIAELVEVEPLEVLFVALGNAPGIRIPRVKEAAVVRRPGDAREPAALELIGAVLGGRDIANVQRLPVAAALGQAVAHQLAVPGEAEG